MVQIFSSIFEIIEKTWTKGQHPCVPKLYYISDYCASPHLKQLTRHLCHSSDAVGVHWQVFCMNHCVSVHYQKLLCSSNLVSQIVFLLGQSLSRIFFLSGYSSLGLLFFKERQNKCLTPVGQYWCSVPEILALLWYDEPFFFSHWFHLSIGRMSRASSEFHCWPSAWTSLQQQ